jgi:hypothetical protein
MYLDIDNIFSKKIDFNHKLNDILIQYQEGKTYNTSNPFEMTCETRRDNLKKLKSLIMN